MSLGVSAVNIGQHWAGWRDEFLYKPLDGTTHKHTSGTGEFYHK